MQDALKQQLKVVRMNALCAIKIRERRASKLQRSMQYQQFLGLALPIVYIVVVSVVGSEDATWVKVLSIVGYILSAVLLVYSIVRLVWRWDEKVREHSRYIGENLAVANEALAVLRSSTIADAAVEQFLKRVEVIDRSDIEQLPEEGV